MDGVIAGMIAGVKNAIVKDASFVCADNFSNITYDNHLTVENNKLQLKDLITGGYNSTPQTSNEDMVAYFSHRHRAPGDIGGYVKIKEVSARCGIASSSGNIRIQLRADNDGEPGNVIVESPDILIDQAGTIYTRTYLFDYEGFVGGEYFWVSIKKQSGSGAFTHYITSAGINEFGEIMNQAKKSTDGTVWNNVNASYPYSGYTTILYDYVPLSGQYTKDLIISSVIKWGNLFGFNSVTPANTSHILAVKDRDSAELIANATDPQSLSGISNAYTILKLVGALSRTPAAGTSTPSIEPFTVTYVNNTVMPTQWANKSILTSAPISEHEANTHVDITGSGYLVGIILTRLDSSGETCNACIQIDGGNTYGISIRGSSYSNGLGSLCLLRFNSSLKVTMTLAPNSNKNVWVVLD